MKFWIIFIAKKTVASFSRISDNQLYFVLLDMRTKYSPECGCIYLVACFAFRNWKLKILCYLDMGMCAPDIFFMSD